MGNHALSFYDAASAYLEIHPHFLFETSKRLGSQARVGANRRKAAALRRRQIAVDGEKKKCFPPQGGALRRIRESPQTLRRKPRHFLPSAPDLVITGCVSPAGGGAHQIEGVDRMNLLLFSLLLVICARAAPSEAEGAEREAGHIRRLPELLTQFLCGDKKWKATNVRRTRQKTAGIG